MLDACFKYNEKVEMPRAFEKFFYSLHRHPTQTLLSYTTEHREHLREIEKFQAKIPPAVSGWLLLRHAGLTAEQRQLVQTHVGATMEDVKIEEVMFLLFGQDYRRNTSEPSRGFRGKGATSGSARWNSRRSHAAYAAYDDAVLEDEYEYDLEETYATEENDAYEYGFTEDPGTPWKLKTFTGKKNNLGKKPPTWSQQEDNIPDEEYEEVFATYLDARRRFADLKAARGFWPVMAVPPSTNGTSSSSPSTSFTSTKENPPKEKVKVASQRARVDQGLSIRKVQLHREPPLHQFAFGVVSLATIAMHVPIPHRSQLHLVVPNPHQRNRRPLSLMPIWSTTMWMLATPELYVEPWTMEPAAF